MPERGPTTQAVLYEYSQRYSKQRRYQLTGLVLVLVLVWCSSECSTSGLMPRTRQKAYYKAASSVAQMKGGRGCPVHRMPTSSRHVGVRLGT